MHYLRLNVLESLELAFLTLLGFDHGGLLFCMRQDLDCGQPGLRMDGDTSKQCHEPFRQARDRSGIEKIPVVFPQAGQAILRVFHEQAKVEPCDFTFELERIHRQPRQFHGRRRHVLQNEKRLNQWIASQITLEFQRLHDPFERQVLMRIGFQGRPPHLR